MHTTIAKKTILLLIVWIVCSVGNLCIASETHSEALQKKLDFMRADIARMRQRRAVMEIAEPKKKLGYIIVDTQKVPLDRQNLENEMNILLDYEFSSTFDIIRADEIQDGYLRHLYGSGYTEEQKASDVTKYWNQDWPYFDFYDYVMSLPKSECPYDLFLVFDLDIYTHKPIDFKSNWGGSRIITDMEISPLLQFYDLNKGGTAYRDIPFGSSLGTERHKLDYVITYALREAFANFAESRFAKKYNPSSEFYDYLDYANKRGMKIDYKNF